MDYPNKPSITQIVLSLLVGWPFAMFIAWNMAEAGFVSEQWLIVNLAVISLASAAPFFIVYVLVEYVRQVRHRRKAKKSGGQHKDPGFKTLLHIRTVLAVVVVALPALLIALVQYAYLTYELSHVETAMVEFQLQRSAEIDGVVALLQKGAEVPVHKPSNWDANGVGTMVNCTAGSLVVPVPAHQLHRMDRVRLAVPTMLL